MALRLQYQGFDGVWTPSNYSLEQALRESEEFQQLYMRLASHANDARLDYRLVDTDTDQTIYPEKETAKEPVGDGLDWELQCRRKTGCGGWAVSKYDCMFTTEPRKIESNRQKILRRVAVEDRSSFFYRFYNTQTGLAHYLEDQVEEVLTAGAPDKVDEALARFIQAATEWIETTKRQESK